MKNNKTISKKVIIPGDTTLKDFKYLFSNSQVKFIDDKFGIGFFNRKFGNESSIDITCGDYTLIVYGSNENHDELFISATKKVDAGVDIDFAKNDYYNGELHHD